MILLNYGEVVNGKAQVMREVYNTTQLSEAELASGVLVSTLPEKDLSRAGQGYYANLCINPTTNEVWYEYVLIPVQRDIVMEQLQAENATLKSNQVAIQDAITVLMDLAMESMMV